MRPEESGSRYRRATGRVLVGTQKGRSFRVLTVQGSHSGCETMLQPPWTAPQHPLCILQICDELKIRYLIFYEGMLIIASSSGRSWDDHIRRAANTEETSWASFELSFSPPGLLAVLAPPTWCFTRGLCTHAAHLPGQGPKEAQE